MRLRRPGIAGTAPASRARRRSRSVIALVTEQVAHAPGTFEEGGRGLYVANVAGRQHQRIRTADDVGERVDLSGPATAGTADRLCETPPFAPNAAR